ncbi:unnamed protein product [Fusarium graminearum]|uniref:Uncharacterized protein n=1 Tax=Gibberella zeae TaxID=5518 RepID=A0A8H3JZ06_GIBZA|nr:unnamed protein product [Fusarium graminearum]CAG1982585.1 unnamed protein product [Fusarium graminearum]CAG2009196.1 unnamed protein product [Fusarium graminearum]
MQVASCMHPGAKHQLCIRNDDETIMSRAYDQFPAITRLSREIRVCLRFRRVNDFESCNLFVHDISEFVHKS